MNLLRWQWRGPMDLVMFQRGFAYLTEFSRRHRVTRWLADTADMPLLGIDEQMWLSEQWLPGFLRLEVSKVGLVLPLSTHNVLVVEHLLLDARQYTPANIQFFSDTAAAFDWLTNSSPQTARLEQQWRLAAESTLPTAVCAGNGPELA